MTTNDKLGPCPLCGEEAIRDSVGCWCKNGMCEMNQGRQPKLRWQALSALADQNRRMREALERRNAAILWLCVNGPDNFGGADFYSFAQKAFPGLGEDEVGDAQGVEGYLRMIESDEDYPSCLDAAKRNMCEQVEYLTARVERLTRERDNARSLLDKSQDDERLMIKEQDRLKAEIRDLRRKVGEWAPYVDHAGCPRVAKEMREEAEK